MSARAGAGPRVVIVGAGAIGAALALRLARRPPPLGAAPVVIERGATVGGGVTSASFGWIGVGPGGSDPGEGDLDEGDLDEGDLDEGAPGEGAPGQGRAGQSDTGCGDIGYGDAGCGDAGCGDRRHAVPGESDPDDGVSCAVDRRAAAEALRRAGCAAHARLTAETATPSPEARGALVWRARPEQTEALIAARRAAGDPVEAVTAERISALAPALRSPPPVAAFAPGDVAIDARAWAGALMKAAVAQGATLRLGAEAAAVETAAGRVVGLRLADGERIAADAVALAAGVATPDLLATVDVVPALTASPAVLVRCAASLAAPLEAILCGPKLEARPAGPGAMAIAEWAPDDADPAALERLGRETMATAEALLRLDGAPRMRTVERWDRPMGASGRPVVAASRRVPGLFVASAHPGLILAPWIAERLSAAILEDAPIDAL